MKRYLFLLIAIILEITATSSLKASEGFTRLWPGVMTIIGYLGSFYFLSLTLKTMPVGVAYAIWSGVGIVLITIVAMILYKQVPDWPTIIGMTLIIAGVVVIHLFSKTPVPA